MSKTDPYTKPAMSFGNRLARAVWHIVYVIFFRYSPRPFHWWRALLLRVFRARLGSGCHIYPKAEIWAPWNLICEDVVAIADKAIIYNPNLVVLKSHSTISQEAYLCGATHDYNNPNFPMISEPIIVERLGWVCARATVQMGVTIGEGAVLGLGSIATKNLEPWCIYAGIPAKKINKRKIQ